MWCASTWWWTSALLMLEWGERGAQTHPDSFVFSICNLGVPSKLQCELSFIQDQPLWGQHNPQVVKSWNKYRVALPTLNQESPTQLYPHLRHTVLESTLMGAYQLKRFHVRVEFDAGPYHISGPKARHEPNPLCISLPKVKGAKPRSNRPPEECQPLFLWTWRRVLHCTIEYWPQLS